MNDNDNNKPILPRLIFRSPSYNSSINRGTPTDSNQAFSIEDADSHKKNRISEAFPPIADKSCSHCRVRKVKCDRVYPRCGRCVTREEECDFGVLSSIPQLQTSSVDKEVMSKLQNRLFEVECKLSEANARVEPSKLLSEQVSIAFAADSTNKNKEETYQYLKNHRITQVENQIGSKSLSWRLARSELGKALTLHLIECFFESCCSFLPAFGSFHGHRLHDIRSNIDSLNSSDKVVATAFAAMGARASPHSMLLGIPAVSPSQDMNLASSIAAGTRRESACRSIHGQVLQTCFSTDIIFNATIGNLESLLVITQMLIFNEITPYKARLFVGVALDYFKILYSGASLDEERKLEMVQHYFLPLLYEDSFVSSHSLLPPQISSIDLANSPLPFPTLPLTNLSNTINSCLNPSNSIISHSSLLEATALLSLSLCAAQRKFAYLSSESSQPDFAFIYSIREIWQSLDQIHSEIFKVQSVLAHLNFSPTECDASNRCIDSLHLRFVTRLDRDIMDITYLIQMAILRRGRNQTQENIELDLLYQESEDRVRTALKMTAFYCQLYISSEDRHMIYHVFLQLELLPCWTKLVLQRCGDSPGPSKREFELSEQELNWLTQGLMVCSFYHPVAETRLVEIEAGRRLPGSVVDGNNQARNFRQPVDAGNAAEHSAGYSMSDAIKRTLQEVNDLRASDHLSPAIKGVQTSEFGDSPMNDWLSIEGNHALL